MAPRSPFDFDVSVSADKRRRLRKRGMSGAFESRERSCDRKGCERAGQYRAPKSPDNLDEFWWFCLDHVREFNRSWNYFENWSEEDFEAFVEADRLWGRPTWSFAAGGAKPDAVAAGHGEGRAWARFGFDDPFQVLGENATLNPGRSQETTAQAPAAKRFSPTERRALEILGAPGGGTREALRERYRSLVKDLHPDMNGGRRDDEARLREVLWAWDVIKASRRFKA